MKKIGMISLLLIQLIGAMEFHVSEQPSQKAVHAAREKYQKERDSLLWEWRKCESEETKELVFEHFKECLPSIKSEALISTCVAVVSVATVASPFIRCGESCCNPVCFGACCLCKLGALAVLGKFDKKIWGDWVNYFRYGLFRSARIDSVQRLRPVEIVVKKVE